MLGTHHAELLVAALEARGTKRRTAQGPYADLCAIRDPGERVPTCQYGFLAAYDPGEVPDTRAVNAPSTPTARNDRASLKNSRWSIVEV